MATKRQLWNPAIYLALITAITVILISTGSLNSSDTFHRLQVTRSLWTDAPQVIDNESDRSLPPSAKTFTGAITYSAIGRDQKRYVTWGIGQSLVMLPADIIANQITNTFYSDKLAIADPGELLSRPNPRLAEVAGIVAYLTFPIINILAIVASVYLLKNLEFTTSQSVYGALSLLFCTTFLHYSQTHQENSLDFLLTICGYLFHLLWLTTNSNRFLWLGLLSLGFNLLVRLTSAINIISVNIFIATSLYLQTRIQNYDQWYSLNIGDRQQSLQKSIIKYLIIAAITYGFFLGVDRFYHWLRFDNLTGTYTGIWTEQVKAIFPELPKSFPFSTPFKDGFIGFLFSPNRSIFLFNPLILVTLYLSIKHWQELSYKLRTFLLSLVFLLFVTITTYSTWFLWGGAGAWGNRYTTTASQLIGCLAIPLAMKFIFENHATNLKNTIFKKLEKVILTAFFVTSGIIQISSVIFDPNLELLQFKYLQDNAPLTNGFQTQPFMFTVGQRLINVLALLTNNFDNWGLRPNSVSLEESQKFIAFAFFPWRNASRIFSPNIVICIQIGWLVLFLILLYLLFKLITNANRYRSDI